MKYDLYESAILEALQDLAPRASAKRPLVILVAGAGRGPLVDRTFKIISMLFMDSKVSIIAIEKIHRHICTCKKKFRLLG